MAVKTSAGKGNTGNAVAAEGTRNKMAQAQEDQQRVKMIEEWLTIKSQGPNSEGGDLKDEDDKELDFDKIMKAMDARKFKVQANTLNNLTWGCWGPGCERSD